MTYCVHADDETISEAWSTRLQTENVKIKKRSHHLLKQYCLLTDQTMTAVVDEVISDWIEVTARSRVEQLVKQRRPTVLAMPARIA